MVGRQGRNRTEKSVSHGSLLSAVALPLPPAVVGYPHDIKGQSIYAYVTVKTGVQKSEELKKELTAHVRTLIGPIATPEKIQFADGLPKTRSGKIMRRILKKVAANEIGDIGDTTTLADPSVVDDIVKNRL